MILYGSTTSPYVRRVRIVARMLNVPFELVDTATDDGQAQLREISPIWKVPALKSGEQVIYDSHAVIDFLSERHGHQTLRPSAPDDAWRERNIHTVIDGALDSAINIFYLRKDGAPDVEYMLKQARRVQSAMAWLDRALRGPWFSDTAQIGLTEIALATTLDWMTFRNAYPVADHPALAAFSAAHSAFEPFSSTLPG